MHVFGDARGFEKGNHSFVNPIPQHWPMGPLSRIYPPRNRESSYLLATLRRIHPERTPLPVALPSERREELSSKERRLIGDCRRHRDAVGTDFSGLWREAFVKSSETEVPPLLCVPVVT